MKTKQEAIEIRRIYTETGCNISETARRCGCHRGTVRRALARDYSINGGKNKRIHPHPEDQAIERLVMENLPDALRSRKLRLTATRIAHIVQMEGCKLSDRQLLKRVAIVRKRIRDGQTHKDVYLELDPPRGAFQVDFGQFECIIDGTKVTVHGLIVSSAYSNAFGSVACIGEDSACLFEGLEACFDQLGGVPPVLRFDNFAPAVFWEGRKRTITDAFSRFAAHHGFRCEFCNPRSGWEKGNVENKVRYVRNNFFLPVDRCKFFSLDALNFALAEFAENDRDRMHYKKNRSIRALFDAEKPVLNDLKAPFGFVERRTVGVDKQGFVQYRGNRYFTRHDFTGRTAIIEATAQHIDILTDDLKPLSSHSRAIGKDKRIQPASELAFLLSKKPAAIPYVMQSFADAQALRDSLRAVRAVDRIEPIMQILTARRDDLLSNARAFDLSLYDRLAGIDGKARRNNKTLQQIETWKHDPGYALSDE